MAEYEEQHTKSIKALVQPALTTKIDKRKIFMKSIAHSYYYEQNE